MSLTRFAKQQAAIAATTILVAAAAKAQTSTPIALNYNFNGILHAGETGIPDDLNGFRSISDRALDFSGGVPANPVFNGYTLVTTANTLDIVHLGNRNTVDGGNWAFDAAPDPDNIGVQPTWLMNPDQSTPQTTTLGSPIAIDGNTTASILLQVSNGGGACDATFTYMSGAVQVAPIGAPDWFGGVLPGVQDNDAGNPGANLSVNEITIDLSANAGDMLTQISFSNPSNANAGYAILAARVDSTPPVAGVVHRIPLNYNFNGIVHIGENGAPDAGDGYRSISDRGLDFTGGVPNDPLLDAYDIIALPGVVDIVHLGNRNTVDGGNFIFDVVAGNGDNIGVQPNWLTTVDQSTPQTTVIDPPIRLNTGSEASFLFQISNGGGGFDVTFDFQSGGSFTSVLAGPDWFNGPFLGTASVDAATADNNLSITERTIDLSASFGEFVTGITFSNATNTNAGYAILAANLFGDAGSVEICNGDGGDQMGCTNCPCGNNAPIGTVGGCINSGGTSTRLNKSGTESVAAMDLRFEASGCPPFVSAVLTSGNALAPANMANPCFGLDTGVQSVNLDGLRCAVQGVLRHGVRPSDANGDVGLTTNGWGMPNGFFNFAAFASGSTKHFQIIHRDDIAQVCGTGQNTSQAISVTFTD